MLNRTIRELFNRAGGWTEVCDVTQDEVLDFNEHLDPEKFAHLILEKVMNICEKLGDKGQDGHYCVDAIRKQFGV